MLLLEGVAKVALDCAHRATTASSCAFCEQEGHLAAPFPSFNDSRRSGGIRRHEHEDFETLACVILHTMLFTGRRHGSLPWTQHLFL